MPTVCQCYLAFQAQQVNQVPRVIRAGMASIYADSRRLH